MIQFDVLGAPNLRDADGRQMDQLLRQPKRLALLAYLVIPRPGTWHRRDTLLGVFWPDVDPTRARAALRNALHVLRQSLGDGVVLTRGDEDVSIAAAALQTDLAPLWDALQAGRVEEVLPRYQGELLPGLYPPESPEFLPWLEGERTRLRLQVARAGAEWAGALEREGRLRDALAAARRVLEINPDDETAVRRVMTLHHLMGDRAGGLALFEEYAGRLAREFEAEPASETVQLADRLRRATDPAAPAVAAAPAMPPADPVPVPRPALPGPRRAISRWLVPAGVMVMILVGWQLLRPAPQPPRIGRSFPVTTAEELQTEPSLSPDGQLVAYARGTPAKMRIFVQRLAGGTPYPLTRDSTAVELLPRWSPGNDQLVFLARNSAWVAPANLGTPRIVAQGGEGDAAVRSAAWSPEGDSLVVVRRDSLMVRPLDGPGSRYVGSGSQLHSCVWSPSRHWIACVSGNWVALVPGTLFGNRAPSALVLFPAEGGQGITITDLEKSYQSPAWSADSRWLWVLSNRDGPPGEVYAIAIGRNGRPTGPFRKVGLTAEAISLSRGRIAYSTGLRLANIWSVPISSAAQRTPAAVDRAERVTSGNQVIEVLRASWDGKWLVYDSDARGNADLYRLPLPPGTTPAERLTSDTMPEFAGDLSPDGRFLAYHRWEGGRRRVYTRRLADGVVEPVSQGGGDQGVPRWSPDGTAIAMWAHDSSENGPIFVMRRSQDGQWQPPRWRLGEAQLPTWMPDGGSLAYVTFGGNVESIPADSGARRVLYAPRPGTDDPHATYLAVRPGRAELWFLGHTASGGSGIWAVPLRGGPPRLVVDLRDPAGRVNGPTFTADDRRFYFTLEERRGNIRWAELTP